MNEIVEGGLTFSFPQRLRAEKYDDWSFYRNQLTNAFGGAKAVDILCLDSDCGWLIEIKNYRQHRRSKLVDLDLEVAKKVRDTLAGLVAASCNANDRDERRFATEFLAKRALHVVLHLEQPKNPSRLFPRRVNLVNLTIKLKRSLKAIDAHPKVVDKDTLKPSMAWTVEG